MGHKLNSPLISSRVLNYNTVAVSQLARVVSTLHVPQSRLGRGNPPDLLWGLLAGNMQGLMNWVVSLCHVAAARLRHEHTRRARGAGLYCEHSYADVIVYSRLLHELHYDPLGAGNTVQEQNTTSTAYSRSAERIAGH